ncbi:MAG TPA: DPP IV N-terminal domain-containing protein [Caulobacteraceae bacterium]|nr:DPP IV N-terminal domain-containing protein [Caulobacteraceae bacterium]
MDKPSSDSSSSGYALAQVALSAGEAVRNGAVYPHWIGIGDRLWYERRGDKGVEYRVVEAETGEGRIAFTRAEVAEALAALLEADIDGEMLILRGLKIAGDRATFDAFGESYAYDFTKHELTAAKKEGDLNWLISPDGGRAAFLRDNNIWIRDIESGAERGLTTDGVERNAYGDSPLARRVLKKMTGQTVEGRWSPDGKRILTAQVDDRHVPDLPLTEFAPLDDVRTRHIPNPTSLPADPKVSEFRMVSIDVETGKQVEARYPRLSAVRMNDTPFSANLAWWGDDGHSAYFIDIERGEQTARVIAFDTDTGAVREVFSESAATYLDLSVNVYAPALIYPIPGTNELVWYSERSGHGHLYLYDLATGALRRPITEGAWQLREVLHVDAQSRQVLFLAAGIAPDEEPYTCKPCSTSLDGGAVKVLSGEPGDHIVWRRGEFGLVGQSFFGHDRFDISGLSPDGRFFIETVGAVEHLPKTYLRRIEGALVATLEEGSNLPDDWTWPEAVTLKAADRTTDIHGLLFKPHGYDPAKSYPLIDNIYGGPQVNVVPKSAFAGSYADTYLTDSAHLATLGCFVLVIDGRGTANRERAFREASYGAAHTASNLEDHIAAIRQLAQRYPIDLEHVGITGFSGGGYATALAALRFGDFFKVAVAGGGNYDQALFWHCWGERYHGRFEPEHYAAQAAKTYAAGLTGKLMLVHGLMDTGCHPGALFQLVQALIDNNKDVDLVLLPREGHTWGDYGARRRLDYFTRHLMGEEPPAGATVSLPVHAAMARLKANAVRPARRDAQ